MFLNEKHPGVHYSCDDIEPSCWVQLLTLLWGVAVFAAISLV